MALGYMMGKLKFFHTCRNRGLKIPREITDAAVNLFRATYPNVVRFWKQCLDVIKPLAGKSSHDFYVGGNLTLQIRDGSLVLPNGLEWTYDLQWYENDSYHGGGWLRSTYKGVETFHEGVLTNNICQSLARVCLSDLVCAVQAKLHARPAPLVHDEVVYIVGETEAEAFKTKLLELMATQPAWWPSGPLMKGEAIVALNYIKP